MYIDVESPNRLVSFDWAIKYLLRNKANFDVLEGFLSELLRTDVHIEEILESESNKTHAEDKSNRVDVLTRTAEGHHIIVEVQCSRQWDYLSRILYGTSKVVCEYVSEGVPYKRLSKVISVSIVFFDVGLGKDYLYRGSTEFRGLHYHDTLTLNDHERKLYQSLSPRLESQTPARVFPEYYIIKVTRFQERVQDKIDEWVYLFKNGRVKKEFTAKGIQSAAKKLEILSLSPEERRIYERDKEASLDNASWAETMEIERAEEHAKGHAEGRVEGRVEGEVKGRREIAKAMKLAGMPIEEIMVYTQLPKESITNL